MTFNIEGGPAYRWSLHLLTEEVVRGLVNRPVESQSSGNWQPWLINKLFSLYLAGGIHFCSGSRRNTLGDVDTVLTCDCQLQRYSSSGPSLQPLVRRQKRFIYILRGVRNADRRKFIFFFAYNLSVWQHNLLCFVLSLNRNSAAQLSLLGPRTQKTPSKY